ncbi:MAG TPA: hypothetical protein VM096_19205 [Vicinamibacterales bacterium]|nr:hypothetical protein [Vicinamibacterales bacterium]
MTFPKKYGPAEVPSSVQSLLSGLLPQLIEGVHPALAALREQYRVATLREVELTGVGFFVHFEVPPGPPLTEPANFTGGSAEIILTGIDHGAGCLVFVRDGRLSMFEGFTYDEPWREDAQVVEIRSVTPMNPSKE